jgi:glycosyltransferase involved in cell wall biosynthesis
MLGLVRAVVVALRARASIDPALVVTLSGGSNAQIVGRFMQRRGCYWAARVSESRPISPNRWVRVFDPRLRALRSADVVTASEAASVSLHLQGVAIGHVGDQADEVARAAVAVINDDERSGPRVLMLGAVNTPHVEHLAVAMERRGYSVVVAGEVVPSYAPSTLPAGGVRIRAIEYPAMLWLRALLRSEAPDLVHAHWLSGYGFLAALMRTRSLIVMAWGSDVYHASRVQLWLCRYALRHSDMALTDSADLAARLVELGAPRESTHIINWGVDLETFAPPSDRAAIRAELGLGSGPVILSPRSLSALYNPTTIIEAFELVAAQIPSAQLVLKHLSSEAPEFERPLPAGATVVGHVAYEQLANYFRASDVCVSIPSSDSSPRSVWEAMACGCPCVLSDLPWVEELIRDGRDALVVEPSASAVALAILKVLQQPEFAAELSANARLLAEANRDVEVEMGRLNDLYAEVITDTQRRP